MESAVSYRRRSVPLTESEKKEASPSLLAAVTTLEKFHYNNSITTSNCNSHPDFNFTLPFDAPTRGTDGSKFDRTLLGRWNEAKRSGALRYDLNLLYKTLPGRYGLCAQLNMERATFRRKPHPFRNLNEPFDSRRFNFCKIAPEEVLFELCSDQQLAGNDNRKIDQIDRNIIIVNNSPIENGHSLLVPQMDKEHPQKVTVDGMKLAVETMLLSGCRLFFVSYNSLLAHASVNHLHFHLYYWPYVSKIITWPLTQLCKSVYLLDSWLVPGFVLQLRDKDVDTFTKRIVAVTEFLHLKSIPHNIFIARAPDVSQQLHHEEEEDEKAASQNAVAEPNNDGLPSTPSPLYITVYIFPRKAVFGAKPVMNFNPAAVECGGQIMIYTSSFFQGIHEARVAHIIKEETYLDDDVFDQLCKELQQQQLEENGETLFSSE